MAAQKKQKQEENSKPNLIFFDEEYDVEHNGNQYKLILCIDGSKLQEHISRYQDALHFHRKIPSDAQNISPVDPVVQMCLAQNKHIKDERQRATEAIRMAQHHYEAMQRECMSEATILAVTVKSPEYDFVPKPYEDDDDSDDLPGLGSSLPHFKRELIHKVEIRLKQIMDLMESHPSILLRLQELIPAAALMFERMAEDTDDNGFLPEPTDSDVSGEVSG